MGELNIGKCADCPKVRQVDEVVRQMGVVSTDEGVEALAQGNLLKASELINVGGDFIRLAGNLDEQLLSTCSGPEYGRCTASIEVIKTVDVICEDISYSQQMAPREETGETTEEQCRYCEGSYVCADHSGTEGVPAYESVEGSLPLQHLDRSL